MKKYGIKSKTKQMSSGDLLSGESNLTKFFGASAIIGLVEILAMVLFAMLRSKSNMLSLIGIVGLLVPILFILNFYKKSLGIKLTILAFVIGTIFTVGLLSLFVFLFSR